MKDWHIITLIILGLVLGFALFSGIIFAIPKMFSQSSSKIEKIDSAALWKQQQQRLDDMRDQQRQMQEQQKQRIRDMQRRWP